MEEQKTNAGRDGVEVHNRLDQVVLRIVAREGQAAETQMSPAAARRVARLLERAADIGEQTPRD